MNDDEFEPVYQPLAEINIIPFVDVMLVLLIIFMITAPLFTPQLFKVTLPKVTTTGSIAPVTQLNLMLDAQNQLFLNEILISETALNARLSQVAQQQPTPALHLHIDKQVTYQRIAEILALIQRAGISQVGLTIIRNNQ
ncbi:MAG: biopolymer transporter ExbD [Thiotrichaceae bacterium]